MTRSNSALRSSLPCWATVVGVMPHRPRPQWRRAGHCSPGSRTDGARPWRTPDKPAPTHLPGTSVQTVCAYTSRLSSRLPGSRLRSPRSLPRLSSLSARWRWWAPRRTEFVPRATLPGVTLLDDLQASAPVPRRQSGRMSGPAQPAGSTPACGRHASRNSPS